MTDANLTDTDGLLVGLDYTLRLDDRETIGSSCLGRGFLDSMGKSGLIQPRRFLGNQTPPTSAPLHPTDEA